jgi:hypothetical protein
MLTPQKGASPGFRQTVLSGGSLRTYRLACAATGEYTSLWAGRAYWVS